MYGNVKSDHGIFVKSHLSTKGMSEPPQLIHLAPEISRHLERKSFVERRDDVRDKYRPFFSRIEKYTVCVSCGVWYQPVSNFMGRGCRMHPGAQTMQYGVFFWTCCENEIQHRGCTSCMHTDDVSIRESMEREPLDSIVEVSMEIIDLELVRCNKLLINDYPDGGPSIEKREGKFYHINRVALFPIE